MHTIKLRLAALLTAAALVSFASAAPEWTVRKLTLAADAKNTADHVLVLHGDADLYVPNDHVQTWLAAMRTTSADYQFVAYSGAVHSFTEPTAQNPGQAQYHPVVAARAFAAEPAK